MKAIKNHLGVDNAKPAVSFLGSLITNLGSLDANNDGKISAFEIFATAQKVTVEFFSLNSRISSWEEVGNEIVDLTKKEAQTLTEALAKTFALSNKEAEWLVEDYIAWLAQGYVLIRRTISIKKSQPKAA